MNDPGIVVMVCIECDKEITADTADLANDIELSCPRCHGEVFQVKA